MDKEQRVGDGRREERKVNGGIKNTSANYRGGTTVLTPPTASRRRKLLVGRPVETAGENWKESL